MGKVYRQVGEIPAMMREIILYGALAGPCGRRFFFDVSTPGEAVRALVTQNRRLYGDIRRGEFRVMAESPGSECRFYSLDETELCMDLGRVFRLHIVPVPAGSKNQGVLKVVLGVAMIGIGFGAAGVLGLKSAATVAFGIKATTMITLGAGMMLNGIGMMISPTPTVSSNEKADERPSYLFNGTLNITEEGNQIPVCYGTPFAGSVVISSGLSVDDVEQTLPDVTGLTASNPYTDKARVTWNAVPGAADYVVRYGGENASWDDYTFSAATTEKQAERYLSNGTYTVMVRARSGSVYSAVSSTKLTINWEPDEGDSGGGDGE